MKRTILIIDDDEKLNELLTDYLSKFDFKVISAAHPEDGLRMLKRNPPDLVILDVMMPDMDGFTACKEIRHESSLPIIMLTARGDVSDRIVGLELGADDYLSKPFEPRELLARIQAILRRSSDSPGSDIAKFGNLVVDFKRHQVLLNGEHVILTAMEFDILSQFVKNTGRVLDRNQILEQMRGIDWQPDNRSVDVLVSRLRQKLKDDPKNPGLFKTIRGTGYMFLGNREKDDG